MKAIGNFWVPWTFKKLLYMHELLENERVQWMTYTLKIVHGFQVSFSSTTIFDRQKWNQIIRRENLEVLWERKATVVVISTRFFIRFFIHKIAYLIRPEYRNIVCLIRQILYSCSHSWKCAILFYPGILSGSSYSAGVFIHLNCNIIIDWVLSLFVCPMIIFKNTHYIKMHSPFFEICS